MKIICKYHDDVTPSMEVYENENETIGYCYVCNTRAVLEGKPSGRRVRPTDVPSNIEYIRTLPLSRIRGFDLPFDNLGYYLVWPSRDFYKRRNWDDNPRYTSPRGVKAPLYKIQGTSDRIIIVEGEFNALSLSVSINTSDTVVSPGSVANLRSCYEVVQPYSKVVLVVDHDPAGIVYGCEFKNKLLKLGKKVSLVTCEIDYNEMFCTAGPKSVSDHFWRNV